MEAATEEVIAPAPPAPAPIDAELELDMTLINLLENCNTYAELQLELIKALSSGHLLLAKAKKNVRINSIDCREVIEANCRIDYNQQDESFTEWIKKPKVDPLLYISALPPPDLKQAQKSFRNALHLAITLSSKSVHITRDLSVLQAAKEQSPPAGGPVAATSGQGAGEGT
jgi:hypothetical protein